MLVIESKVGINIIYSGIVYTEKDWVQLKVRHYPIQDSEVVAACKVHNVVGFRKDFRKQKTNNKYLP